MPDACWNTIGVRGDGSCPELERYVHCRNCPVYSRAALDLLDSEVPPGYSEEWTTYVARPKPADEDDDTQTIVIFRIGSEWLALPMPAVLEVADLRPIHSLPHRRSGVVLGLANVRGELVVCVSLGQVLGLEQRIDANREARGAAQQRLLVIRRDDVRSACPVDQVHGIHRVRSRELREVPATIAKAAATYSKAVVSWNGHSVGLLDDQLLCYTLQRSLA
jgi:chemotaxis-related protein WspD